MANEIYSPLLLPIQFFEADPDQLPQYQTRHFDDYVDSVQRKSFETPVTYKRKWQTSDTIKLQFESNFAAIQVQIVDCEDNIIISQASTQVRANIYMPGYFVYENTISLASLDPGTYYPKRILGGTLVEYGNPIEVAENWPNTILFEYSNSTFFGDVVFETGIVFGFRCDAFLTRLDPGNERTAYRDQKMNPTILKSVPYRGFKLEIGHLVGGVPDSVMDLMNWIWSCDTVLVDGKSFAVADGANFEETEVDKLYPFRMWSLNVQEGVNRYSKIVNPTIDTNKRILIAGMIDATLFGDLSENAGSNLVPIENVN